MKYWNPYQQWSWKPNEIHEVYLISYANKDIQTTTTLSITSILVEEKHNTKTSRNGYLITIYQRGPLYEPYFIAIDNQGQVIIRSNKKTVATYMVGELKVLI